MSDMSQPGTTPNDSRTSGVPFKKRKLSDSGDVQSDARNSDVLLDKDSTIPSFSPRCTSLVSILRNDTRSKSITLHARFDHSNEDAIMILQKTSFPSDAQVLQTHKVFRQMNTVETDTANSSSEGDNSFDDFPFWQAKQVMTNDVYHRLLVEKGLESVNGIDMTVIYPAQPHHFRKFCPSSRHIIHETPEVYARKVVPFLNSSPRDLAWVDNILAGTAEQDRVLYSDQDPTNGFTVVLDYRWDGTRLIDLHALGLVQDHSLTCLRDLRASHIPMLKAILAHGRRSLIAKYGSRPITADSAVNTDRAMSGKDGPLLCEDQLFAYFHYPPTFYRLHVHFSHIDTSDDAGVRASRAHVLEEVIRNLELDSEYYAKRVLTICLHDNSPLLPLFCRDQVDGADSCAQDD